MPRINKRPIIKDAKHGKRLEPFNPKRHIEERKSEPMRGSFHTELNDGSSRITHFFVPKDKRTAKSAKLVGSITKKMGADMQPMLKERRDTLHIYKRKRPQKPTTK